MAGMKQSLQLKLGQQLTMTPQLQQAIRLLQLSTLELQTEIQLALDSNLMLEEADDSEHEDEPHDDHELVAQTRLEAKPAETASESIPDDLPLDLQWDDIYDGATSYSARDPDSHYDPLEHQSSASGSLREHLLWQAELTTFSPQDRAIAEAIIDSIRDDGYLGCTLADLQSSLPPEWGLDESAILQVLRRVQLFDPIGVAARDPQEALQIQLRQLAPDTPYLAFATQLVERHLDLLVNRQYAQLMRRMKISEDELQATVALIQTLNPRPGSGISSERVDYVIPDVYVHKAGDEWRADLNQEAIPRIRVNSYYASLIRRADNSADNLTMRDHLQEARWFINSLHARNDTLLKVARCIVARQQAYFDHGEEHMLPLVLREVAEEVDMHESTISRITTQKYMHTPRGTLEFKYFFSSHVMTTDGDEASATAIRARIRRLISAEDPASPLSDNRLMELLHEEGIDVARRTIAKYREAMAIASSTERRRLR
jgi:RNA polymerase sigma-54 factor